MSSPFVPRICLTGGIACGKSLFSKFLNEEGVETLDADDVVHELLPEAERRRLAPLVFANPAARKELEARLHPLVRARIDTFLSCRDSTSLRLAVIPLLFETGWDATYDIVCCLRSSREVQIDRMIKTRGYSPDEARARLAAQMPVDEKAACSDYVVTNEGTADDLRRAAHEFVLWLRTRGQHPRKIVHLLPALEQGGVEHVVCDLGRVQAEAGLDCVVASRGGALVSNLTHAGVRHCTLDLKSKNPLTYFSRVRRLRRFLAEERPDLVCVHSRVPAWLFVGANRTLRLPWLSFAHGANSVSRYSAVMTRGDLTVVPSKFLSSYVRTNYALPVARIRLLSPAIDFTRFDPARLDHTFMEEKRHAWRLAGRRVIMAVGRLTPLKGYDTLIRAFERLPRGTSRLVIVGDAEPAREGHRRELTELVRALALTDEVVFAGGQSRVPECLALADVLVSSNTVKPESFGLSMAEALAMNRPVVAQAFGGAAEVVRDGIDGVLVPIGSPEDAPRRFADAILRALELPPADLRTPACARFGFETFRVRSLRLCREAIARFTHN